MRATLPWDYSKYRWREQHALVLNMWRDDIQDTWYGIIVLHFEAVRAGRQRPMRCHKHYWGIGFNDKVGNHLDSWCPW